MEAGCNCKTAIGCVDPRVPVRRASYMSLYKWPESDAEFVKSVAMARRQGGGGAGQESPASVGGASVSSYYYYGHHYSGSGSTRNNSGELLAPPAGYSSPRVVDSYSCRQMYLRSYTFSKKKETVPERTMACLGRVRERGAAVFPLFLPQRHGGSSSTDAGSVGSTSNRFSGADAGAVARGESRDRREDDVGLHGSSKEQGRKQSRRRRRRKKKKGSCAVVRRLHEASCSAVRAIFRRLLACTTSVDVADGAGGPPAP